MKKISSMLLAISSLISCFLFICFYMPRWFAMSEFFKEINFNINAGEGWTVFFFWFITLALTIVVLITNKEKRKLFFALLFAQLAEILMIPLVANFEFVANTYVIFTTIVNILVSLLSVIELKTSFKKDIESN